MDSWKKKSIAALIRKLDLSFQLLLNNEHRYHVTQQKRATNKLVTFAEQLIQFNLDSASFDVVIQDHKQQHKGSCTMSDLFNVKILAISKTYHLIQTVVDLDFNAVKQQLFSQKEAFQSLVMIKIDVVPVLTNSSILLGYYPEALRAKKGDSQPPQFFTVNLCYIDLLKAMTGVQTLMK